MPIACRRGMPLFAKLSPSRILCPGIVRLLAFLWLALLANPAAAQTCNADVPSGNYGNVDILSGGTNDTTASFTVTCTGGIHNSTLRLCMDVSYGNTVGGLGTQRALVNGSIYLLHDIYTTAARNVEWGAWGGNTLLFPFGPGGTTYDMLLNNQGTGSHLFTMYGRIAGTQQTIPPGSYTWSTASVGFTYSVTTQSCPTGTLFYRGGVGSSIWYATILPNCLVTATSVDFGATGPLVANVDAAGAVTARCTSTTPYAIALSNGTGGGTGPAARKMVNGAIAITYGLYQDAARAQPFGSTLNVDMASGTGTGLAQTINVYGRVPPQATPVAGTYSDTITVTLTY